ncbi:RecQ family ATP-dependent DNA helicase [Sulfuriroseicoccus oceanibius]|uniref:ATP-dependent DNA helicase RecQ n=1 Tax=Sulfuriroseicoccus oceanibius TaxID=2707525 RepID=A0A6B3LD29_9BACT|nr:ATP-dependent DNA helicase RecQ [Sulfuriroseicoccus oceanibius]QQL45006.1 RecQ family ATP-dependent DNA helicase [Sulfuriroseicoccus oceanibius]
MSQITDTLKQRFGHDQFRDGQREIVEGLVAGRSMLAVFPTGGGKSLCYQLPALLLDGVTLVISPLIALMKDQVDALRSRGIHAARLDSSLTHDEYGEVMRDLANGSLKLLYVAPERLANEGFRQKLASLKIAMVAIDEAHCISEWGHNFRPDYLKLAKLCHTLRVPRVLALTATATPAVANDIRAAFDIAPDDHIQLSFHRHNLDLRVTPLTDSERPPYLLERLKHTDGAVIVYVTLQHTAERIATYLNRNGVPAQAYHAGLPAEQRAAAQDGFMTGNIRIIVATIAFGMGIDKADIRTVIHYNLPKSLENYSQEIGRAGRDGKDSVCELLACRDDLTTLENFTYGDTPEPGATQGLIDRVLRLGDEFDISTYDLSYASDVRLLVVSTLLTYLEMDEWIEATRPFYSVYQVKIARDFDSIVAGYDDRRKAFLRKIFDAAEHKRSWIHFHIDDVAQATGEPRDRIVAALTYLEEAGDIALRLTGVRQGYRLIRKPDNLRDVGRRMNERFAHREQSDLDRIAQVVELAEQSGCITNFLTSHFGESLDQPCGHCCRCRGTSATPLPGANPEPATIEERQQIDQLIRQNHAALRTPRQLARFLTGLSSPATTRARLTRDDTFALLERLPFSDTLTVAESMMGA